MANKTLVSPRGIAIYPKLTTPDTKFKAEGEYSIKLRLSAEAAQPLIEMIDSAMDASYETALEQETAKAQEKAKKSGKAPVKVSIKRADPPYKEDPENPGSYIFTLKMKAQYKTKEGEIKTQKPSVADRTGKVVQNPAALNIGGGSEVKVGFNLMDFFTPLVGAGVSLRLKGVQILKLVQYNSDCGFKEEEGEELPDTNAAAESEGSADASAETEAPADDKKDF